MADELKPICPSCGAKLPKVPQRKTKCKACGDFIYNKYTPDDPTRRLMNQAQADAAERAWVDHYALIAILKVSRHVGIDDAIALSTFHEAGRNSKVAASKLFRPLALAGNRDALMAMAELVEEDRSAKAMWKRFLVATDLKELRERGIRSAQLTSGSRRLCPICSALVGMVVDTSVSSLKVMPMSCTCEAPGQLLLNGFIRRADGASYVDFERSNP